LHLFGFVHLTFGRKASAPFDLCVENPSLENDRDAPLFGGDALKSSRNGSQCIDHSV